MQEDPVARNAIIQFILANANLGIRKRVLSFKDQLDLEAAKLLQQGVSQDQIIQRIETSNKIFDEELEASYTYTQQQPKPLIFPISNSNQVFDLGQLSQMTNLQSFNQPIQSIQPIQLNPIGNLQPINSFTSRPVQRRPGQPLTEEQKAARLARMKARQTQIANRTPEEMEAIRLKRQENEEQKIENEKNIRELGVKTLSQEDVSQIIAMRRAAFHVPQSDNIKVLLVCVSYDENHIRQTCLNIVQFLNNPNLIIPIEFFCINPEAYGPPRGKREIWIDREHYFQAPFGENINPEQYPGIVKMFQNGPYDLIIYAHCPIYGRRDPGGVGRDLVTEGQELNAIMKADSILVIYPFDSLPFQTTLGFRSIGIDLIGITHGQRLRIRELGLYMKHL
jgi:hypothetical protein